MNQLSHLSRPECFREEQGVQSDPFRFLSSSNMDRQYPCLLQSLVHICGQCDLAYNANTSEPVGWSVSEQSAAITCFGIRAPQRASMCTIRRLLNTLFLCILHYFHIRFHLKILRPLDVQRWLRGIHCGAVISRARVNGRSVILLCFSFDYDIISRVYANPHVHEHTAQLPD